MNDIGGPQDFYQGPVRHLEVHVTHDCNFQCEGCGHFNQHRFRGTNLSVDLIESWYKKWYKRISPPEISILGGEPFLNPYLPELCHLTRKYFPFAPEVKLVTNASLIHLHPNLWKDLIETDIILDVSIHSDSQKYAKVMTPKLKIVREWRDKGANVIISDVALNKWDDYSRWRHFYIGEGENIMPFEDNNPEESWNNCPAGQICFQLHEGHIWKCAPLAFLPLMKKKYPNISEKWDPYLKYKPLTSDCSDEEINEFFSRGCESVCSMCSSKPVYFMKTKDPLRNEIK